MTMTLKKSKTSSNLLNDYHLLSFDSLDSTNEEAKRLARAGGGHGAVIWAKSQTNGKGRMGRNWFSSEGNLFVSVLVQPKKPLAELAQLSFVAAVAALESVAPLLGDTADIKTKWPNDILLGSKKMGGILLESFRTEASDEAWVVVGVGINVDSFPPRTEFPATCIKDAGVELVSAKIILSRFIHHFIGRYDQWMTKGFSPIRKEWLANAWQLGERITVRLPDSEMEGVFEGIDPNGSLMLITEKNKKQLIHAGDVYAAGH
jgi:BirA family biotin operon repressor/biotin-[acetyl-CoA-carboxylase] ligase